MSATIETRQENSSDQRPGAADFIIKLTAGRYRVTSNTKGDSVVIYRPIPGKPLQARYEMTAPNGEQFTGTVTATSSSTGTYVDSTGKLKGKLKMQDPMGDTVNWRSDDAKEFGLLLR